MLAPIFWLIVGATQTRSALDTGDYDLLDPTFHAFSQMWRTVDFGSTSSTRSIICTGAALLATAFAASAGYALARLHVARHEGLLGDRHRHAADPGRDVPAAGVPRLRLAQAEHADRAVRHADRDDHRLHGVLHAGVDLPHALVLPRAPARARGGGARRRLHALRRLRARSCSPTAAPGLLATFVYAFLFAWDELLFAASLTQREAETIPIGIRNFIGNYNEEYDQLMAAGVVSTIPVSSPSSSPSAGSCEGLTAGAVKG